MKQIIVKGIIHEKPDGENDDSIFIGDSDTPFVEEIEDEIKGKIVNVRYWMADQPETKAQLIEGLIQKLYGSADAKYGHAYSDYTGYLWTDEDLNIGGHDLIDEIRSNVGKFLYMEIEIL